MKPRFFLLALLGIGALATAAPAADNKKTSERPALQLEVSVPAVVDPLHEDDVAEAFAASVRDAFRRRGYEGRIDDLRWGEDPRGDVPLLTVRLLRWERTRTGGIDCTFGAAFRPVGGEEQSLGTFMSTELGLGVTNRWTLAEAFRDAARRAADDLWRRLSERQLVPGTASRN